MNYLRYLISGLIGVILIIIINNMPLVSESWISLLPWCIVGLAIGSVILTKKESVINGLFYGFSLTATFLITGFNGTEDKILSFSLFLIFLSLIGAICGAILTLLGYLLKKKLKKH